MLEFRGMQGNPHSIVSSSQEPCEYSDPRVLTERSSSQVTDSTCTELTVLLAIYRVFACACHRLELAIPGHKDGFVEGEPLLLSVIGCTAFDL
jgi:hypothetical protein